MCIYIYTVYTYYINIEHDTDTWIYVGDVQAITWHSKTFSATSCYPIYISVNRSSLQIPSPDMHSELFLCLRTALFRIAGVEQPSVERNLVKRRSLCGAFWQASTWAARVAEGAGSIVVPAISRSVIVIFETSCLVRTWSGLPGKAKQIEKTNLHHTEPYLLMLRHPLLEAEAFGHVSSSKQPGGSGGGWDDIVINVAWHDQEFSINQNYSILSSRKGEKYGSYICLYCLFVPSPSQDYARISARSARYEPGKVCLCQAWDCLLIWPEKILRPSCQRDRVGM